MVYAQCSAHAVIPLVCYATLISIVVVLACGPMGADAVPLIPGDRGQFEYKHYCSDTLSDAIRMICGGRYNSLGRKYPDSVGLRSLRASALKRFAPSDNIFYRPVQTGPIHECCRRPCGYSELKMYCAPD